MNKMYMIVDPSEDLVLDFNGEYFQYQISFSCLLPTKEMAENYREECLADVVMNEGESHRYKIVEVEIESVNKSGNIIFAYDDWQ